jgi:putative membrane protein
VIRLLASAIVKLIANTVALIVGNLILEDMSVSGTAFVIAVLIFTGIEILVEPLLRQIALSNARALLGGTALIATLIGLIITAAISDGLSITGGVTTWVLATLIVWAVALVVQLLLPLIIFKKALAGAQAAR